MLWNWYTIDTCFIARSWHVSTKGQFAGSCIGVFLLVLSAQWLHRVAREYDAAIARRKFLALKASRDADTPSDSSIEKNDVSASEYQLEDKSATMYSNSNLLQPILFTLSHQWIWDFQNGSKLGKAYPSLIEHIIRAVIFTIQWGQSYIIMLLFMYYNGYLIISCILGAFFGRLLFNYEPITCVTREDSMNNDKKCCL
jgi:copper transporter 1